MPFGEIIDGEVRLNEVGVTIRDQWVRSAEVRKEIHTDEFVMMPNHLHGIIFIVDGPVRRDRRSPSVSQGENCIGAGKAFVSSLYCRFQIRMRQIN